MKTPRSFFAVLIFTFMTTMMVQAATGKMIVHLTKYNGHTVQLRLANLQKKHTRITLVDLEGKEWVSVKVNNEHGYANKLNMQGMPEGAYLITVENQKQSFNRAFYKGSFDLAFFEPPQSKRQNETVVVLTGANGKGKKRGMITRITLAAPRTISLQLANIPGRNASVELHQRGQGRIVNEAVEGDYGYAQNFDMRGMMEDAYYLVVKTENLIQIQFFTLTSRGIELEGLQILEGQLPGTRMAAK